MTFKKMATALAATALVFSSAAQATAASSLSLSKSSAVSARAATATKGDSQIVASPLFFILGLVGVVAVLEITGAINIFDDSPDSP